MKIKGVIEYLKIKKKNFNLEMILVKIYLLNFFLEQFSEN